MTPFEDALPIRKLLAFKGQRNFVGFWWCTTNLRHVGFESWCERDQLMRLDFDPEVKGVASQPFKITLPASAPQDSHLPDYFVRKADGTALAFLVSKGPIKYGVWWLLWGILFALCQRYSI